MTGKTVFELEAPPDVADQGGHEVLRCFIVDGGLSVALRRSFDDAGTWGVLLADLARHAARIYARETDIDEDDALQQIRAMLDAEWQRPAEFGATRAVN